MPNYCLISQKATKNKRNIYAQSYTVFGTLELNGSVFSKILSVIVFVYLNIYSIRVKTIDSIELSNVRLLINEDCI